MAIHTPIQMACRTGCTVVDDTKAQRLLDAGLSVREVAGALNVTTQAIYRRISIGKLARPEAS